MKIYTKTGDDGTTSLLGGKRVSKGDIRIDTYGTVDELNAYLGLLRDQEVNGGRKGILVEIQNNLFTIGAMLATDPAHNQAKIPSLSEDDVALLEREMDAMDQDLPTLRFFVLPGGNQSVSVAHIARTVCRRAERLTIALNAHDKVDPLAIKYLNRLSDYLFILSRKISQELGSEEIAWKPDKV